MNKLQRRILIAAVIILTCVGLGFLGWNWYDANVDRSGWDQAESGAVIYKDFHGDPLTGWQTIDGSRYFFSDSGAMQTGWLTTDAGCCYLSAEGKMLLSWQEIDGGRRYLGEDGLLRTGWQDIDGQRYYFSSDGLMVTGWLAMDSSRYYLNADGTLHTGWLEENGARYYFGEDGAVYTGWLEAEEGRYYISANGTPVTGWVETPEGRFCLDEHGLMRSGCWAEDGEDRYYLNEDGTVYTGWLEQGEYRYYLQSDGKMAVGPTVIDDQTYYFTPHGIHLVLVNYNHYVPDYYEPDLVSLSNGFLVDSSCKQALEQMLADCRAAGYSPTFNSAYRSIGEQQYLLNLRTSEYMAKGLSYSQAYAATLQSVAIPGTSEHHLGLAVDLLGDRALTWLREHCWEYGFILRYLNGKSDITGIIYEPWHFRYVGVEVAMDMKDSGLCLEEYLGAVPVNQDAETGAEP